MAEDVTLSFQVKDETAAELDRLAEATQRSRDRLLEEALDTYLAEQTWQLEKIKRGLADAAAGRTVPHEEVTEWLLSWGTENEKDPPKCG